MVRNSQDYVGNWLREYGTEIFVGEITSINNQGMMLENGESPVGFSSLEFFQAGGREYAPRYEMISSRRIGVSLKFPIFHMVKKQRPNIGDKIARW